MSNPLQLLYVALMNQTPTACPIIRRPSLNTCSSGTWDEATPPLLRRIYAARGAHSMQQAQPRLNTLPPPELLGGMTAAVNKLAQAIAQQQRILVVGDFDCDGASACAVAVRGLHLLGAQQVRYAVPNRMIHGYGLSPALVAELADQSPDILITVDHGIACHAGIALAKQLGWQVIVTDHHLPGEQLPPADVIVNPNLPGDAFPSKALAGVGVMFYLLMALRRHLREQGAFNHAAEPDLSALLDLVAVGTVADLVPLDSTNRALVGAGLRRLRRGLGCTGLQALIAVSGRDATRLSSSDISFALAPRINAAGRLEDMTVGIELLLSDNPVRAQEIAATLEQINTERRNVQQLMTDEAQHALARIPNVPTLVQADTVEQALSACLYDASWHPGVIGLVASKMKDHLHRPVIALAPAEPDSQQLRGSARSIDGLHIRDVLVAVDSAHPGLIERFGGHAMAAGLSLPLTHLADFERAFKRAVAERITPQMLQAQILSDGPLQAHEFNYHYACLLRDAGPWGQGFPEPLFDGEFAVLDGNILKQRHLKLRLRPRKGGPILNAIHFNGADQLTADYERIAYRLAPDEWRGNQAVQLIIEYRYPL